MGAGRSGFPGIFKTRIAQHCGEQFLIDVGKRARRIKTSGSFGGRTAAGKPCPRVAGWGVRGRGDGRCRDHTPRADAKLHANKKKLLELYRTASVSLKEAAQRACGVDQSTIWRWRQADPEFDAEVNKAISMVDEIRYVAVEDATFNQIVRGEAAPAVVIFWLKNRAPHRWRDRVHQELTGPAGAPLIPLEVIRSIVYGDQAVGR